MERGGRGGEGEVGEGKGGVGEGSEVRYLGIHCVDGT